MTYISCISVKVRASAYPLLSDKTTVKNLLQKPAQNICFRVGSKGMVVPIFLLYPISIAKIEVHGYSCGKLRGLEL